MRATGLARKVGLGAAGATMVALVGASAAFACTSVQGPYIDIAPATGPAASHVTVSGGQWAPGPVSVDWYDKTSTYVSHMTTATASGGGFSAAIFIPANAAPDNYYIVATQGTTKATSAFTVQAPATSTGSGGTGSAGSTTGSASGTTGSSGSGSGSTSGTTSGGTTGSPGTGSTATGGSVVGTAGSIPGQAPGTVAQGSVGTASGSGAPSSSGHSGATTGQAGQAGPVSRAGTTGPVTSGAPGTTSAAAPNQGGSSAPIGSSPQSVVGDIWGGFGRTPRTLAGPSLTDLSNGGTSELTVGAVLLAVGLSTMMAGFVVAELRRRRVTVQA